MYIPIIVGSDKTTVSVGTGNNSYYPLYMSLGNFHNTLRRAHSDAVVLVGFLAVPKGEREHELNKGYTAFKRQLLHASLAQIFSSLKPGMESPELVLCPDGYYRRALWSFAAYIADYPEQVDLSGVNTGWCPR
jgi:hypothetical protein